MALQTLNTIKNWFRTGFKPTQNQFWDTWDSFRHKYEKVPVKDVEGLDELLLTKADKVVLNNHLADKNAHAPQVNTDWNSDSGFSQLLNKPEFKTINGEAIVGTGDIAVDIENQGLKSTLDTNPIADYGNSSATIMGDYGDSKYNRIEVGNDLNNTSLFQLTNQISLSSRVVETGDNCSIALFEGDIRLNKSKNGKQTIVKIAEPIANTQFEFPAKLEDSKVYTIATTDEVSIPVSATAIGIVNNVPLQELGGVDKLINGVRIGIGERPDNYNLIFGREALDSDTSGSFQQAIGNWALSSNTSGQQNLAVGSSSLSENVTGSYNTSIGMYSSSYSLGNRNTVLGNQAFSTTVGIQNATGNNNIVIGYQAGRDISTGSGNLLIENITNASITTGNNNIVLNPRQKSGITTGSGNTIIGGFDGAFSANDSELVVLATGTGKVAIRKNTNGEIIAPNLTNGLITSGGDRSLLTKEYLESKTQVKDNQILVAGDILVQNSWHGQTILFTGSGTITVPATLPAEFSFNAITMPTVTINWVITSPFTWLFGNPSVTPEKTYLNFTRVGNTNNIILSA
ncbi:hypothetical protein OA93_20945 [Flavobacterium sp. KMS]|uniref:hypothetical protein n=1 Tax=Flavobacterium sp. KMS TaxID=1566023 RepID=UPI00057F98E0|nr:hypothetical protein [Flavobacterium sp. KMS]KIA93928.1 hypothetical protein OA93_20945 [Flavobacterium sp. KMS]